MKINSKYVMITSAITLGIIGIGLTFLPEEIAEYLTINSSPLSIIILQILGSLYLGFAMLNWMARTMLIGGIYGKPLVIGNMIHFLVSSFALIKASFKMGDHANVLIVFTIIYVIFTLCFSYLSRTNPNLKQKP